MSFFRRKKAETRNPSLASMLSMNSSSSDVSIDGNKVSNGLSWDQSTSDDYYSPTTTPVPKSSAVRSGARMASISTISGLHSHRNVKPVHQMLLAESMVDHSLSLQLKSRFNQSLRDILSDNTVFPYFIQYMESLGNVSKHLIRFWIQTECLIVSQKNIASNVSSSDQSLDDIRRQFIADSIGVYDKYLSESSPHFVDIPQELKDEIKEKLFNRGSDVSCDLFGSAQKYAIERMEALYYEPFLKSSYYCKFSIDYLTTDSVTLADILFNDTLLATNFIEFMESEGMKAFVDFLIMFEKYRKVSNDYDDAISLFNRFFRDNTDNRLGFSDSHVMGLNQKLVKNNFNCDCLDSSAAILIQYFEKTYLKQFIESQFFIEYLNNCFQTIQTESHHKTHKRTNSDSSYTSDCSFVSSLSTRDTECSTTTTTTCGHSPAVASKHRQSNHVNEEHRHDSLWKRDLSGKLQFTHVDKYGRIWSALEPEPQRHTGALVKVMKKFSLHSTADKDKEEIAWKIATMIVNDVNQSCNGAGDDTHHLSQPYK
ncbi:unnamed protein product [Medioppia subpectinata]|uniref:RGS domain-containing protein n=1 Tax=Medioppia subpectinata TaxID=1979941 RepID=A0A7R9Q1B0_9ACAR|nr:unnamed protein product [Medioppia subpectinata]CAG2108352.1 unnamed protein product [Medioppia subpectinata]